MTIFVRVVDAGSFTAAAERSEISTAMVSKHIQYLEAHLGMSLLLRTTRRHKITEFGKFYYDSCIKIIRMIDNLDNMAADLVENPKGLIRITAPCSFGIKQLMPKIDEFYRDYKDIEIDVHISDNVSNIVEEGFDAAIRVGELPDSDLIARPLAPYRLVICASPAYLEGRDLPKKPQDLQNHDCLALGFAWWSEWRANEREWRLTDENGTETIQISARLKVNDASALHQCALKDMGIVMLPELLVRNNLQSGSLVQLLSNYELPSRPMNLLYYSHSRMPSRLRVFIDFVLEHFGRRT